MEGKSSRKEKKEKTRVERQRVMCFFLLLDYAMSGEKTERGYRCREW